MIIYSVAAALVSIGFLLIKYQVKWYTADGEQMLAGFHWGRLWGVYTDPNYGGVFAAAAIVLCIYYVRKKQGLKKLFYAAAAVLNLLYLIFTDSRTAALAVCVSISFWAVYLAVSKKEKKRLFLTIVACVLLSGVFILGSSFVKKEYMKFADIKIGREEDLEGNISNGRLELWQSGLEVFKTRPLYGTGYNSFLPYTEECLPDTAAVNNPQKAKYVSLHNEFVNILVYQGIIGIAIFTTFAVCIFVYWLKSAKKFAGEDQDYMAVLAACILVTVVSMVFLLDGLHTNSPGSFMLWTFAGYSMHYCRKMRKAEKQR